MTDIATSTAPVTTEITPPAPQPATPPAPAPAGKPVSKEAKAAAALAQVAAQRGAQAPAQAIPEPAKVEPTPAPAKADVPPADPAKTESGDRDIMLSKAQAAALKQQREAYEAKQAVKREAEARAAAEAEAKALKDQWGSRDPKALLEVAAALEGKDARAAAKILAKHGITMEGLAKAIAEEPDPEPEDPKDLAVKQLQAEVERIKAEKEADLAAVKAEKERLEQERQAELAAAEADRAFQKNVSAVTEILKTKQDVYPALASFSRAPQEAVRRWNAHIEQHGEAPDIDELLADFNKKVEDDVDNILASDVALKAYLERHRDRALSVLGVKQSATSPASTQGDNGQRKGAPSAIPQTAAADAGSRRSRPQSQDEKVAAALAHLATRRS